MCHIPDILDVAKGIEILLNENGLLVFEDPYLGLLLTKQHMTKFMMSMSFYFQAIL